MLPQHERLARANITVSFLTGCKSDCKYDADPISDHYLIDNLQKKREAGERDDLADRVFCFLNLNPALCDDIDNWPYEGSFRVGDLLDALSRRKTEVWVPPSSSDFLPEDLLPSALTPILTQLCDTCPESLVSVSPY